MAPVASFLAAGLLALNGALAHPGHSVQQEAAERGQWLQKAKPRSVRSCANELRRRGHLEASLARRQDLSRHARLKRSLPVDKPLFRRDYSSSVNESHASTLDVTVGSDETLLFADDSSCLLQPEVTQGPYYIDGELIRSDMSEDQPGIPLFLDIQLIDTSTCQPVPAVFLDIWHCNSTGVYSGVSASGNGNENDTSNLSATFLRGLQQTDSNGVAQFESIFPGHYTGRAPHIHVLTHNTNSTIIRTNATLLSASGNFSTQASHVGQIFFDQDLISQVEATSPYTENTQVLTVNSEDGILAEETEGMDPFVEFVLLGEGIEDGVLAWISLGIDPTVDEAISSAGTLYEEGGVANENSVMGGGGPGGEGPPGGNGTDVSARK
ncbi:uncharacterized protein MYCFIDRAFT_157020 [Pseudocercospora fijiensis CIRAD86]|uniref:Intradiol ring-cleavage dioxygenases domain-containing protein n=1 Tax=Pseudocercospora fijiensis (strain CIRAD86) TaxID=383855 RepID=M3AQX8_PSEFD|nr:uncharacterized protein MYCFIDRAFT_157020 [Pseudocercospora fijiensis CIRAD86]EME79822.1 hypothetical protein MYCFIDRAFT_157020 [Pseudocercospora fijiensis CIRAD86]